MVCMLLIMAARKSPSELLFLFIIVCLCSCCSSARKIQEHGAVIKGMFVFGSSLVDSGNNNFLQNSGAKADYLPYGMDFPYGPSGRFTNGKNVIDILGGHLKLPLIPVFADPSTKGSKIVHGVNYASAASGILDETGSIAGHVISLNHQIMNFKETTLPELEAEMGCKRRELLGNYLFVVGTGGNDYSLNYFLKGTSANVSLEVFTTNLTTSLSMQLVKLYNLGARKFVLISLNPIGCTPVARANRPKHNGCVQGLNRAAHLFNAGLKLLVDVMRQQQMPRSELVFVNSYKIIRDIVRNPISKGFKDTSNACCEVADPLHKSGNGILCKIEGNACEDRSTYIYFDGIHPTEAVNIEIATKAYNSTHKIHVYPINVHQLAAL
ncbi:hypothetical protein K2173_015314 [Erythroxylum novogranatense]|uniref:GDSL esterase/lipase n=1 Tax=Erythroxylum novogranatense TaxID=1862640 RepID=A0AAV8T1L9_9ROSI|nr:hypothetical protein K2173_015314 [Erythroxylum novogranatense]